MAKVSVLLPFRVIAARVLTGVAAGLFLIVAGHRISHAVSKWALHNGLVELHGEWFVPRGFSWAALGLAVGGLLWAVFRRNAMLPAVVAAFVAPLVTFGAFVYLYELDDALLLFKPWLFEVFVVLLTVPGIVYIMRRRNAA